MPRKTKIIFITVFIIVGALMLGLYFYMKNKSNTNTATNTTATNYNLFNPFGTNTQTSINNSSNSTPNTDQTSTTSADTNTQTPVISKFQKISTFAVAGAAYLEDTRPVSQTQVVTDSTTTTTTAKKTTTKVSTPKVETVPSLRYVNKATGHIYEMYLDTKVEGEVSNSTIPTIYEAIWDSKAETVIYRYLEQDNSISSFMATLGSSKGEFLPSNITDISLSPDKTKFFYLVKNSSGVVGYTRAFNSTKVSQVFNSPFSEWLSQWVTPQKIFLTTKASAYADGYLYSLNISTGTMSKIFGGVSGLTTLANNDGSEVLYSSSTTSGPKLGVFDVAKHTTYDINTYGLPEKCIWGSDNVNIYCAIPDNISGGDYPDSWYQGRTSFNDNFVKINTKTSETTEIADSSNETALDATNLFLNKAEDTLFFINKKDSTLWSLSLN